MTDSPRRWIGIDDWFAGTGRSWADVDRIRPGHNFEYGRPGGEHGRADEDQEHRPGEHP